MKKSWPTLLDGTTHLRLAACTWRGERRRRDWMAPLLYPRRERRREKPMVVGWRPLELFVVCFSSVSLSLFIWSVGKK
jgi:hypothetical protein